MSQVKTVGVELWDTRCSDYDAGFVGSELEDVEGGEEGLEERCCEPVVWWGEECEDVGFWLWGGAGYCAAGMGGYGGDGDGEEGIRHCDGL